MFQSNFGTSAMSDVLALETNYNHILSGFDHSALSGVEQAHRIRRLNLSSNVGTCDISSIGTSTASGAEDRSRTNLIINYLPQSFEQSDLQRLFEQVGAIRQCKLIRDKNTGASLCYGFVDYVNPQHAALAIQLFHGYETEQKRLRVAYASSGGRRFPQCQRTPSLDASFLTCLNHDATDNNIGWEICVSGLPSDTTEMDLLKLFTNFGFVVCTRFLSTSLSEPSRSQVSPVINEAFSDRSDQELHCVLNGARSLTASIIFDEKSSADMAILKLNSHHLPELGTTLCLRLIGPVSRDAYSLFCLSSRSSQHMLSSKIHNSTSSLNSDYESPMSYLSRRTTMDVAPLTLDPLMEKFNGMVLNRGLQTNGNNAVRSMNDNCDVQKTSLGNGGPFGLIGLPPRAIIRNKEHASAPSPDGSDNVDFADLLDHTVCSANSGRNHIDRFSQADHLAPFAKQVNPQFSDLLKSGSQPPSSTAFSSLWSSSTSPTGLFASVPNVSRSPRLSEVEHLTHRLSITTPLLNSPQLSTAVSQSGGKANVFLKLENLQPTGSAIFRGMEFACRKLAALGGVSHLVCPSAGNAGVAAAHAASALSIACTVVTPVECESITRQRLAAEAPSAKLVAYGSCIGDAYRRAESLVHDANDRLHQLTGASTPNFVRLLHPYDNVDLWTGYETLIDELPSTCPPDAIITAVGGGGMLAGLIQGLWNRSWSSTHIIAAELEGRDCLSRSISLGQVATLPGANIRNCMTAPSLAPRTWSLVQCHSVTPVTFTDAEALRATRRFLDEHGILVEPLCGAALNVVYSGIIAKLQRDGELPRPANIIVVICGGRNFTYDKLLEMERRSPKEELSVNSNTYIHQNGDANETLKTKEEPTDNETPIAKSKIQVQEEVIHLSSIVASSSAEGLNDVL